MACNYRLIIFLIILFALYLLWRYYNDTRENFDTIDTAAPYDYLPEAYDIDTRTIIYEPKAYDYLPKAVNDRNRYTNVGEPVDNAYFDLWNADRDVDRSNVMEEVDNIVEGKMHCTKFKNVNQCMSTCSDTAGCSGFYIDSPGTCCMMINPPYEYSRDRFSRVPDNTYKYANSEINNVVKSGVRNSIVDAGKAIFNKTSSDGFNDRYISNLDRETCKGICPKCIMGKCPNGYRCARMMADPRYNQSCIITNQDMYNEKTGNTFDGAEIPYLDEKYALNEYAGYDANTKPIKMLPPSGKIVLDDGLVDSIQSLRKQHGQVEHFDPYINTDGFDPESAADDQRVIAIRGGNDPYALAGYSHCNNKELYADMILGQHYRKAM